MINSLFRRFIKFLISFVHLSFPGVPSFPQFIVVKIHLNHRKASPCVFNFSFLLFDHPFITGVLHGSSTRWFVKDSFHSSIVLQDFSRSYDPPSYTQKIKHGAQHMFCFEEFKYSSSCIPKCNSFYNIFWGGVISFLIIWVHVSWFTCCQEWGILNPSISSLELSWVIFHLKPSLRFVAIMVLINDPSSSFILLLK